jgi:hypothetical protein
VKDIEYSAVDITTVIEHLPDVMSAFNLIAADVISVLSLYAPGALDKALDFGKPIWDTQIIDLSLENPPGSRDARSRKRLGFLSDPQSVWKFLNAMWLLPVVFTVGAAYALYREMGDRIRSYDKDLLQIKSDEIRRISDRSDFFDKQFAELLVRYENISKQTAEIIKALVPKAIECCAPPSCDPLKIKDPPKWVDKKCHASTRSDHRVSQRASQRLRGYQ